MTHLTSTGWLRPAPLPRVGDDVGRRVLMLANRIGLPYDTPPERTHPELAGTVILAGGSVLLAGTRAFAPMLQPDCAALARAFDCDFILARMQPSGALVLDLFVADTSGWVWHDHYSFLAHKGGGGSLVPDHAPGPAFLLASHGLHVRPGPFYIPCRADPALPFPIEEELI